MIQSNIKHIFCSKIATIHTASFKCIISTAKEGLFKRQSTVIIEGDYFQDRANAFPCAKIIYSPSLKSSDRLSLHDGLSNQIDELGEKGLSLRSAIDLCFRELKEKGIAMETINLA
jgi:hypothetical protein